MSTKDTFNTKYLTVPVGYTAELDTTKYPSVRIVFKKQPRINNWEEYKERVNLNGKYSLLSFWEDSGNCLTELRHDITLNTKLKENEIIVNSKEEGEALIALSKLLLIRKEYVEDWVPNYLDSVTKYCIIVNNGTPCVGYISNTSYPLSFPTKELAKEFLCNNIDLIEKAKMFL